MTLLYIVSWPVLGLVHILLKVAPLRLRYFPQPMVGGIGVGAQSTLRGHKIFARKICTKISKMPEFYMILARKIIKNTRIFIIFARKIYKIPEFYMIFARKCPDFT